MRQSGTWLAGVVLFAAGIGVGWAVRTFVWTPPPEAGETLDEDEAPPVVVDPSQMRVKVTTAAVESGELALTIPVLGIVRSAPAAERVLSSRAGGRVFEMLVNPGESAKRGELLMRLDPAQAQAS